ncbi:MAG: SPOR domain-containing protein [Pseudomonadota bacterium]
MADVDFDDFDDGYGTPMAASGLAPRLLSLAGAASSAALIVGLGIWGYNLAVRDVTGIPVIRALEGPMRIAPDNPGGEVAAHQGLAVNAVAAVGVASPPPERLVLAPRPVELSMEDTPGLGTLDAVDAPIAVTDVSAPVDGILPTPIISEDLLTDVITDDPVDPGLADPARVAMPTDGPDPDAVAKALAEALALEETPVEDALAVAALAPEVAPEPAITDQPMATSVRPQRRPGAVPAPIVPTAVADVALAAPAATPVAEVDAGTIAAGTRLVQLGAFDTPDQARSEWGRLSNRFPDLLATKSLVVQSAESGGRTFYRLRALGFAGADEARDFCTSLLEQNASCIPVEQR